MKRIFTIAFSLISFITNAQKIDTITSFDYDTATHQFINSTQQVFGYNGGCHLTRYQINFWDVANNVFGKYFRTTNSLLANSATSQSLSQIWDDLNSKWENYRKGIYTYTVNPKLPSSVLNQNYNTTTSTWVNYENNIYSYDVNGNDTSILTQSWINNSWINNFYYKYSYDAQRNIVKFEQYKWVNNSWVNYYQIMYTYNSNFKLIADSAVRWNNSYWQNVGNNSYYYDNMGKVVNYNYKVWDTLNNVFKPYLQYVNSFDVNGNKDSTITYLYNNSKNYWDTLSLDVYHYNGCILPLLNITLTATQKANIELSFTVSDLYEEASFYIEKSTGGVNFHEIEKLYSYQNNKKYFDNDIKNEKIFYRIKAITKDGLISYSNIAFIENKKINNLGIKVYPNPARTFVNLQIDRVEGKGSIVVTDLYGKTIKVQPLSLGINSIDVSGFAKGMYLVSTITTKGKTTKKVVVE
jgi:hypothetical protein